MNLIFNVDEILDFFEGPELFTAVDQFGARHLLYFTGRDGESEVFVSTPITEGRLLELKSGSIPVRNVFEFPEIPFLFTARLSGGAESLIAEYPSLDALPEKDLPPKSYVLIPDAQHSEIVWTPSGTSVTAFASYSAELDYSSLILSSISQNWLNEVSAMKITFADPEEALAA